MEPLHVPRTPCPSCPYRRDVPSGVWDATEYEKLVGYDDPQESFATFHCHQEHRTERPTVCRGWLTVAAESAAARIAVLEGLVPDAARYDPPPVPLWSSGREAAEHGLRDLTDPSPAARRLIAKLNRFHAG